jgi:predicted aspartyl protease
MDDMGLFRTTVRIEHMARRGQSTELPDTLVDTGSEYTWVPTDVLEAMGVARERTIRFVVADGRTFERHIGYAIVHAGGVDAPDIVVFAEPGDMVLLGAHSLEGLNLRIDPVRKELVPAGPVITAALTRAA